MKVSDRIAWNTVLHTALRCATTPPCYHTPSPSHALVPARSAAAKLRRNRCYHSPYYHTPCCLPRLPVAAKTCNRSYHTCHYRYHTPDCLAYGRTLVCNHLYCCITPTLL